jgi:stage IV sporulation protein B
MKKFVMFLTALLFTPISALAYSEYVIPGGENIGIQIDTKGLVVVGFYKVDGKYIGSDTLKVGDTILEVEGTSVDTISELSTLIDEKLVNNEVNVRIKRNNKEIDTKLTLVKEDNVYKTGLYVKEKVTGIGTMTYIDPITKIYGALGHEIVMSESDNRVEIKSGNIFESYVNGIDRSTNGTVGSKNATITYNNKLGTITKNVGTGIFGKYTAMIPGKEKMEVAKWSDIKTGKATIYTITDGNTINEYEIEIMSLNSKAIDTNKSISFKVTDKKLLEESGGIVQGMSGSPIVQDGKIIGAVTHVLVDEVTNGYGVFIRTMLEEGER